jgi:hypothetical protein
MKDSSLTVFESHRNTFKKLLQEMRDGKGDEILIKIALNTYLSKAERTELIKIYDEKKNKDTAKR